MTDFTIHTPATADGSAAASLEAAQKSLGFVPNLYGVMAEAPELLSAYQTLVGLVGQSGLTPAEQHILYLTASYENGCTYCVAAHTGLAGQALGADEIEALREGRPLADQKRETFRRFVARIVNQRGWVSDGDVADFLAAGYTRKTVLAVVLGVGAKTLSNYTNHLADTPLDGPMQANAWTKPLGTAHSAA